MCDTVVGNSPPFLTQTCLFTIFPYISTTNRGSQFWENREKAGLSKTGVSCLRLCDMHLVIFWAKKYKPEYRTSTYREKYVGALSGTTPFTTAWYDAL